MPAARGRSSWDPSGLSKCLSRYTFVLLDNLKGIPALCIARLAGHGTVDVLVPPFWMVAIVLQPVPLDEAPILPAYAEPASGLEEQQKSRQTELREGQRGWISVTDKRVLRVAELTRMKPMTVPAATIVLSLSC